MVRLFPAQTPCARVSRRGTHLPKGPLLSRLAEVGLLVGILGWSGCTQASSAPPLPQTTPTAGGPVGSGAPAATSPASAPDLQFPSTNRPDVRGVHGAVSSDHPLASAVGYEVLRQGGNATDAVVAMATVLAVVRPHMNGVGGDAFALFHDGASGRVVALNGSGRAGSLATPDFFAGMDEIPQTGGGSVSVPGAVQAWHDALERFGTRSLAELIQPAIGYARDGFPVSWRLSSDIESQGGSLDEHGRALYFPDGRPARMGSLLRNPALARTLETIGRGGPDAFYRGAIAQKLAGYVRSQGGYLTPEDFAAHHSEWVEPLTLDYLGHRFHVLPPNTQGVAQLQQFQMAKSFDFKEMGHNTSSYLHTMVELKKLAIADRDRWVADPNFADIPVSDLLDPEYLRNRAGLISPTRALESVEPGVGAPLTATRSQGDLDDSGDTVYLTAVDRDGNAVSWIQSLFAGFGSGLVEPETGVVLQNRGALFVLTEGHPNRIAPGKRPYHTLTPLLAHRNGRLAFTLGTPGGDSQTESIFQIVHNLLLFGMTPQEAIEAPRYRAGGGLGLSIEDRIDPLTRAGLEGKGHRLRIIHGWTSTFGGAQMIYVDPESGTLAAAADPRREAYALAF